VANDLYKNKKTESIPCSLSFSNDHLLSDVWRKIRILINTSDKLNEYVYNNIIWNQIDILDSEINEL
jgi:type II restriction/modification system DNA methylase subunit YeeA